MYYGERFNSATHLLGLVLAVAGTALLVVHAAQAGAAVRIVSDSVFGLSMVVLYAASTLCHSVRGPAKRIWATVDHCAIYLLIAGTYTPLALITVSGSLGWGLLAVVWSLAALGIARELRSVGELNPSVLLYLAMGWSGIAVAAPLVRGLHGPGSAWLLGGCLFYMVGIVFYRMGHRLRHGHGIWHLFVLAGTASHYVTVLRFV